MEIKGFLLTLKVLGLGVGEVGKGKDILFVDLIKKANEVYNFCKRITLS